MKTSPVIIGLILFAAIIVTVSWPGKDAYAKLRGSANDYQVMAASGTPTVLKLGSETCPACKAMNPVLDKLSKEYGSKLNVIMVDVYKEPALTRSFNVTAIPVVVFVDSSGKVRQRVEGYMSYDDLKTALAQLKLVP